MKEVVDIFHEDVIIDGKDWTTTDEDPFTDSVMERTLIACEAFSEQKEGEEDEFGRRATTPLNFDSCFDVLESISNAFQYRIFMTDFAFWFFPANAYNWSHTLRVRNGRQVVSEAATSRPTCQVVSTSCAPPLKTSTSVETLKLNTPWAWAGRTRISRYQAMHTDAPELRSRGVIGSPKWGISITPAQGQRLG